MIMKMTKVKCLNMKNPTSPTKLGIPTRLSTTFSRYCKNNRYPRVSVIYLVGKIWFDYNGVYVR